MNLLFLDKNHLSDFSKKKKKEVNKCSLKNKS